MPTFARAVLFLPSDGIKINSSSPKRTREILPGTKRFKMWVDLNSETKTDYECFTEQLLLSVRRKNDRAHRTGNKNHESILATHQTVTASIREGELVRAKQSRKQDRLLGWGLGPRNGGRPNILRCRSGLHGRLTVPAYIIHTIVIHYRYTIHTSSIHHPYTKPRVWRWHEKRRPYKIWESENRSFQTRSI